jgi:hypothetical protein
MDRVVLLFTDDLVYEDVPTGWLAAPAPNSALSVKGFSQALLT